MGTLSQNACSPQSSPFLLTSLWTRSDLPVLSVGPAVPRGVTRGKQSVRVGQPPPSSGLCQAEEGCVHDAVTPVGPPGIPLAAWARFTGVPSSLALERVPLTLPPMLPCSGFSAFWLCYPSSKSFLWDVSFSQTWFSWNGVPHQSGQHC